jgi:catechol 2,3-dioxygenase-like lactoylglutathione lyase family enzyme
MRFEAAGRECCYTGSANFAAREKVLSQACVTAVRSVDLAVVDPDKAQEFFTRVWGLEKAAVQDGITYLRASGPHFYTLSLRQASETAVLRVVLGAQSRADIDELFDRIQQRGSPTDGAPRPLPSAGGGYGFGVRDPEGRGIALVCDVSDHEPSASSPDRPTRLSHVNLNCRDNDATLGFMTGVLGFRLSDETKVFRFIRCGRDHHSMVLGFNSDCFLNHVAFEMPDLDAVMRGIGRMRDFGYGVEWGPGRHGPGHNVFAYFCGPEEVPIEYTAEMQQVDEDHRVRGPDQWSWPPGRLDHWGVTAGPSRRVKQAQQRFPFVPDGYKLEL